MKDTAPPAGREGSRPPPSETALDPVEMVILQGTPLCNLNCSYCYLTEAERRSRTRMPLDVLERAVRRIFESPFLGDALRISWHSGEPLLMGRNYYDEATRIMRSIRDETVGSGFRLTFDMQTNAVLLDDAWADFFDRRRDDFEIGVSCDGPAFLHDMHRRNWSGRRTHDLVLAGMERLRARSVPFDVTAVVSPEAMDHPADFAAFFQGWSGAIREFHFNPYDDIGALGGSPGRLAALSDRYAGFIEGLLEHLAKRGSEALRIRNFTIFFQQALARDAAALDARRMSRPFRTLNIMPNGDVSTFYAGVTETEAGDPYGDGKGFVIGNLLEEPLETIARSGKLARMEADFEESHAACEAECPYWGLCSGGYNIVKMRRFGRLDVSETPECRLHVKTFADAVIADIARRAAAAGRR